jgi:F420 biosynthesis protein FbiB-like protein
MEKSLDAFWQTIFGRRSIRRYRPDPIPRELLERMLTAAIWAPSAHNRQPWRFAMVTRPEAKEALARSMAQRWREDMAQAGLDEAEIKARVQRSRQRLTEPPALVVGCLTMQDMDDYDDARLQQAERTMAIQSLALALGNLMLAAHHEGLGTCWICAPLFAPAAVRSALELPNDWEPQAIITLGWPDEERTSTRKPLQEVVVWG